MAETAETVATVTQEEISRAQWKHKVKDAKELLREFVRQAHKDHTL